MKTIIPALCLILFTFIAVPAQDTGVLVAGNPPLTRTMIDRLVGLMEWSLDVTFTSDESSALRETVIGYWKSSDEKCIRSVTDSLAFEKKLAAADDGQRRNLQPQVQQALLKAFREDSSEPMNRILLDVYNRRRQSADNTASRSTGSIADLAGRWQVSHMNSVTTQNVYTGALGDANGMIAEFDIKPNGRVIYSFYISQANYGCTTKIKTSKTGRVSVDGSTATFVYDTGTTTSQDSCNARNNYTKNLGRTTDVFEFGFKAANGRTHFCFSDGKLKDCAVKMD